MEKAMEVHWDQGISKATQQIVGFVPEAFSEHWGKHGWALGTGDWLRQVIPESTPELCPC